jgi:LmbE family N-acetylglucosaminyl deacetylase
VGAAQGPWLVIAPHDDDVQIGAGLAVQAAVQAGIEVHVVVSSDGRMGYVDWSQRHDTVSTRAGECLQANEILGVAAARVHKLDYPDGDLQDWQGVRDLPGGPRGLSYDYTRIIRQVAPEVVLGPTPTDLHGDHRAVSEDLDIACFHASGGIWRHLGPPVAVPLRIDYAVYCDFPADPDIQLRADPEEFDRKLASIAAYASQPQIIESIMAGVRGSGPVEYLQRRVWNLYKPSVYDALFLSQ